MTDFAASPAARSRLARVVISGASMAGLLAARALADHAEELWLVDRDSLSAAAEPRARVPQGRHVHAFLARGVAVLERLLPGSVAALVARGAVPGDALANVRWCPGGVRFARMPSDLRVLFASRPLIEAVVRERVMAIPTVRVLASHVVQGLAGDRERVRGVVVEDGDGRRRVLEADLVVDASGRASHSAAWLEEIGGRPPPEQRVPVGVTYASVVIDGAAEALAGDLAILCGATPAIPRSGVVHVIESGRAIVSLGSMRDDRPPRDWSEILAFAGTLVHPDVADVLRAARPVSAVTTYRIPFSIRRRHDAAPAPRGFLALGDALCAFNPVYGQGMSVAAIAAEALDRLCRAGTDPASEPERYYAAIERDVATAWQMGVAADLRFPWVEGRRDLRLRIVDRWIARVQRAARTDPEVARAFVRVASLVDPREALLSPRFARRVLHPPAAAKRARAAATDDRLAGALAPTRVTGAGGRES